MASQAISALRALTYRLSSTPTAQLPRCVPQLSASVWTCRDLLSAPSDALKRAADDGAAVVIHRLRTQLTTLLQDRSVEGRWAAVVLTKAVIEAGGYEVLSKCHGWVRSLLALLKRPDPPTTKALAVLVLTRIFMLTWDHVSLVREITTPTLPAFVSTCLSNAVNKHCSGDELLSILEAFQLLLPHHPTIFRPHEAALRSLLLRLISGSEELPSSTEIVRLAQRLLALLPYTTPKQGGADKWDESLQQFIESAHQTCDQVLRPIIEPADSARVRPSTLASLPIATQGEDAAGLSPWTGVAQGATRLMASLNTIAAFFATSSQTDVTISVGKVFDLLSRVLAVTCPQQGRQSFTKPNPEITREERDILYSVLPRVHVAAFQLLEAIMQRLGQASIPFLDFYYEHAIDVSAAEDHDLLLRSTVYDIVAHALELDGMTTRVDRVQRLSPLLQRCCRDAALETMSSCAPASSLLAVSLAKLDPRIVPRNLRTLMDRTAILTSNKAALLASVLNPAPDPSGGGLQASLLPILARMFPDDAEVEALIRPRMPVVRSGPSSELEEEDLEEDLVGMPDDLQQNVQLDEENIQEDAADSAAAKTVRANDQERAFEQYINNQQKRALPENTELAADSKKLRLTADQIKTQPSDRSGFSQDVDDNTDKHTTSMFFDPAGADNEDGSDIELPPLTLEQDTEDESS